MILGLVAIIGIAGLPPVPTAAGRALLSAPFAACSVLTAALIAARFAVAAWQAYGVMPRRDTEIPHKDSERWFLIGPALVLAVTAFGLGAVPWSAITIAALPFADPHTIVDALLHHALPLPPASLAWPAIPHVLLLAAATVLVAATAAAVRPIVRTTTFVHRLHDVHNGIVGDYVTWLTSGVAGGTGILVILR
jgi:hypothetical protein